MAAKIELFNIIKLRLLCRAATLETLKLCLENSMIRQLQLLPEVLKHSIMFHRIPKNLLSKKQMIKDLIT